jgi:uncharacterized membrane protein YhhN
VPDPSVAIPIVAALSALLHIRAEYAGPRWQVYLFKPLTTTLVLLLAISITGTQGARYQVAVVVGLICSLVGDVMLMLPRDRFVAGLASFLLAHLAYIAAFQTGMPMGSSPALLLPLLAATWLLLRLLWRGLGAMRGAVLLYAFAMLVMVWRAWARSLVAPGSSALLAAVGATLFMVSDSVLALNRFRAPFRQAQAVIMSTYVAAQLLIALSIGGT